MKTVAILGHFAKKKVTTSGQIIKTRIVSDALVEQLGATQVALEDTCGTIRFVLCWPFILLRVLISARNIVILPAQHGVRLVAPTLVMANAFFRRRLHYVVVGGWMPGYVRRYSWLRISLMRFHHIYVETLSMQCEMEQMGFRNVCVVPNCKLLNILSPEKIPSSFEKPYRLCTFSRVIKEKGIEDAIRAVCAANEQLGETVFTLDIYGQIEQRKWFQTLMANQPESVVYRGIIPFNQSTDVLKDYFALLFPTYYSGEAFAGTLIDAMAAGLPVIASDWHNNPELVDDGETGLIFPTHSVESLTRILVDVARNPKRLMPMRGACLTSAARYQPSVVLQPLLNNLK